MATDTVKTAIVQMGMNPDQYEEGARRVAEANAQITESGARVVGSQEKIDSGNRVQADGFTKLEAKYDAMIRIEMRRAAEIRKATAYLDEGAVSQERYGAHVARINAEYDRQAAAANRASGSTINFGAALGGVSRILGAFGITLSLIGLVGFARNALAVGGAMAEMARQAGVSTELLQALQFAGTQTHVSFETINSAVSKFTKNVGEASEGNKTALASFDRLGVKILDANGALRSNDAILKNVAVAIAAIKDPARRVTAEVELFSKSGQQLETVFGAGAESIDGWIRQARELGLITSQADLDKLDEAADKVALLKLEFQKLATDGIAFAQPFLMDFLGALERLPDNLSNVVTVERVDDRNRRLALEARDKTLGDLGKPGRSGATSATFEALGGASNPADTEAIKKIQTVIDKLKLEEQQIGATSEQVKLYNALHDAGVMINSKAGQEIAKLVKQIHDEALAFNSLTVIRLHDAEVAAQIDKDFIAARVRGKVLSDAEITAHVHATQQQQNDQRLLEAQLRLIGATNEQRAVEIARITALIELRAKDGDALTAWEQSYVDNAKAAARLTQEIDRQQASFDELANFADQAFDRIGEAITQAFATGKIKAVDFLDIGRSVLSELSQEFIKLAAINPFKNWAFGSSLPTLGSVSSAAGGASSGGLNLGSMFSGGGGGFSLSSIFGGGGFSAADMGPGHGPAGGGIAGGVSGSGFSWGGAGMSAAMNLIPLGLAAASGQHLGGQQIGGAIGGTIGGIAGAYFGPVGSMIGSMLGNMLGSLVGGMFGKTGKPSASGYFNVNDNTGVFDEATSKHGGDSETARASVDAYGKTLSALLDQTDLTITSGRLSGYIQAQQNKSGETNFYGNLAVGQAGGPDSENYYTRVPLGGGTNKGEEGLKQIVADLIKATLQEAVKIGALGGSGATATMLSVLHNTKATTIEALGADLEFAKLYEQLAGIAVPVTAFSQALKAVNAVFDDAAAKAAALGLALGPLEQGRLDAIAKITTDINLANDRAVRAFLDPLGLALEDFDKMAADRLKEAQAAGADLVLLEKRTGLERQAVIEQVQGQQKTDLQKFWEELTFGSLSGVSPAGSLSGSRAAFEAAAAQAAAGDISAQGRLIDLGSTFLGTSRGVNASSTAYQTDLARVREVIAPFLTQGPGSITQAITDVGREQARLTLANTNEIVTLRQAVVRLENANATLAADVSRLLARLAA